MPRDPNQLAKMIADMAYGEAEPEPQGPAKHAPSVELGRHGGKARAAKLSPERRSEIAKVAAAARWGTTKS
jgi:hypothetical protein